MSRTGRRTLKRDELKRAELTRDQRYDRSPKGKRRRQRSESNEYRRGYRAGYQVGRRVTVQASWTAKRERLLGRGGAK